MIIAQKKIENEHICSIWYQTVAYKAAGERGTAYQNSAETHKHTRGHEQGIQRPYVYKEILQTWTSQ